MKSLITTILATLIVAIGYAQPYLPLTAGSGYPLTGSLVGNAPTSNYVGPQTYNSAITIDGGFIGLRSATDHSFNIDVYNNGSPVNAYSVSQSGNHNFKLGTATFGGALTGTSAMFNSLTSNVDNIAIRTGSNSNYGALSLGRTSSEFFLGIAGVPDNFGIGTT